MLATEPSQCEGRQNKFVPLCLPAWLPATRCRLSPENKIIFHTQVWALGNIMLLSRKIRRLLHDCTFPMLRKIKWDNSELLSLQNDGLRSDHRPRVGKNQARERCKGINHMSLFFSSRSKTFWEFSFRRGNSRLLFISFLFLSLVFLARNLLWRKQGNKRTQTGQTDRRTNELLWHWAAWQINAQVYQLC